MQVASERIVNIKTVRAFAQEEAEVERLGAPCYFASGRIFNGLMGGV